MQGRTRAMTWVGGLESLQEPVGGIGVYQVDLARQVEQLFLLGPVPKNYRAVVWM